MELWLLAVPRMFEVLLSGLCHMLFLLSGRVLLLCPFSWITPPPPPSITPSSLPHTLSWCTLHLPTVIAVCLHPGWVHGPGTSCVTVAIPDCLKKALWTGPLWNECCFSHTSSSWRSMM